MDRKNYRQWEPKLTPLPCPFCGTSPKVVPTNPEDDGDAWGAVACVNKRCPAQPQASDGSNISDMRGPGAYKDMAIRRWNKREPDGRSADEIEHLRHALNRGDGSEGETLARVRCTGELADGEQ